jgi:hypothetical protein
MTVRRIAAVLAICCAPLAARAQEEDNPYKNTKVGDYATYKMTMKVAGQTISGTTTQTVTAKSEKEATLKTTGAFEFMGNKMEIPAQEQKIDLTKPFDPSKVGAGGGFPPGVDVKVEKKGKEMKEKVKAAGKEYDCTMTTYKLSGKAGGQEISADIKTWMSKDMPLGLVKMDMAADFGAMKMEIVMELEKSGTEKK